MQNLPQADRFLPLLARLLLLVTLLFTGGGCANGPRFQPLPMNVGEANLYVYRPQWPVAAVADVNIVINGKELGIVHSGGYLATHVAPGMVVVTGKTLNNQKVTINAEAGKNYYVRVDTITDGEIFVGPWIKEVPENTGFQEINELKLSL